MDDELVVHEDDIVAARPMGLLEATQHQEAMQMGLDLSDPEQAEAYRQAQEEGAPAAATRHSTPRAPAPARRCSES